MKYYHLYVKHNAVSSSFLAWQQCDNALKVQRLVIATHTFQIKEPLMCLKFADLDSLSQKVTFNRMS